MIVTRGYGQGRYIITRGLSYREILSIIILASCIRLRLEMASRIDNSDLVLESEISGLELYKSEMDSIVQLISEINTELELKSEIHDEVNLDSRIKE